MSRTALRRIGAVLGRSESKDENASGLAPKAKDKVARGTGACRRGPFADLTNAFVERVPSKESARGAEERPDKRSEACDDRADLEEAKRFAKAELVREAEAAEAKARHAAEEKAKLAREKRAREDADAAAERKAAAKASLQAMLDQRDPKNWVSRLDPVDQAVVNDPRYVAEYAQECIENMRLQERNCPEVMAPADFLSKQEVISDKMRSILVDWLVEVHLKFKLTADSLFLTVGLLDRFLALRSVARNQLQLVGVTCLLLASKYVEVYAPEVRDFVNITDRAYTRREIMDMEVTVLTVLKFRLTQPSPLVFLKRFGRLLGVDEQLENLAQYILELSLVDARMARYTPSHLASASLLLANKVMKQPQPWPERLHAASHQTEQSLRPCGRELCALLQGAEKSSLQAVRKKFSSDKYNAVAKLLTP